MSQKGLLNLLKCIKSMTLIGITTLALLVAMMALGIAYVALTA